MWMRQWSPDSSSVTEELLARAEVRLRQAKLDALLGRRYDAEEFDRLVAHYRDARRAADRARLFASQSAATLKGAGAAAYGLAA